MPDLGTDLCDVLKMLFSFLSPSLLSLCVVFQGDSATGADFMKILSYWSGSLQNIWGLRLKYNYREEDNEVCRCPSHLLILFNKFQTF
jgi:hypothetical protein